MIYTIPAKEMAMLTTLYGQPHRFYHNIDRINFCLAELEKFISATEMRSSWPSPVGLHSTARIVTYAIWWHDAVYNPYSSLNEDQSEDLFRDYHHDVSSVLSFDERESVREAIRATKYHTADQATLPTYCHLMLDIDLAGLGQDWQVFFDHGRAIREEYAHLNEDAFTHGRLKFFELLQQRPTMYYTEYFRNKYENAARKNVDNEIRRLYSL